MSFVGGSFAHDIFVSYAHGQDLSAPYSNPRRNPLYEWSRLFVDNLRSQLDLVLSDSIQSSDGKPDVWMDLKLNLTGSLEGNLEREIQGSALLLKLMSSYYLRSRWCCDEARLFSEAAGRFAPVARQERIFVVSVAPTDRGLWPPTLKYPPFSTGRKSRRRLRFGVGVLRIARLAAAAWPLACWE